MNEQIKKFHCLSAWEIFIGVIEQSEGDLQAAKRLLLVIEQNS